MRSRRSLIVLTSGALAAVLSFGPMVAASAAPASESSSHVITSRASVAEVPDSCALFSTATADALFALKSGTPLTIKLTSSGTGSLAYSTCTVTHLKLKLTVSAARSFGGFGGPYKCYSHSKLGSEGRVCVSVVNSLASSFALFTKGGINVSDDFNKTLPKQGALLYTFALVEYAKVKA